MKLTQITHWQVHFIEGLGNFSLLLLECLGAALRTFSALC